MSGIIGIWRHCLTFAGSFELRKSLNPRIIFKSRTAGGNKLSGAKDLSPLVGWMDTRTQYASVRVRLLLRFIAKFCAALHVSEVRKEGGTSMVVVCVRVPRERVN